jgi:hypothetical protein
MTVCMVMSNENSRLMPLRTKVRHPAMYGKGFTKWYKGFTKSGLAVYAQAAFLQQFFTFKTTTL